MKKTIILSLFGLSLLIAPSHAKAGFDPIRLIDPLCVFACENQPNIVNNTNSNNVNSNINSPGATVVTNGGTPYYNGYDDAYRYDDRPRETSLSAHCYPVPTFAEVGESITWRASVSGGNGNYNISWDGSNGLDGIGSSISKRYNSDGYKSASIVVRSGGQTITRNCSSSAEIRDYDNYDRYYDDYDYRDYDDDYYDNRSLSVSCSVNTSFAPVGTEVEWRAYVSGGNGNYKYKWYGTDDVRGSSRNTEVSYNSPGTKTAYVIVKSGSREVTRHCSNSVVVGTPNYTGAYYNGYVPQTPSYNPPVQVVKVEVPVKETPAPAATSTLSANLAAIFSLDNVPWGWVAILVIFVLICTIVYLMANNKKI